MQTAEQMRTYAQHCLDEAAQANLDSEKRRLERLAEDWSEMAEAQDWLDGKERR